MYIWVSLPYQASFYVFENTSLNKTDANLILHAINILIQAIEYKP